MAILTAYDAMGAGLNMANTTSAFVPSSGLTPDGTPNVRKYDSDTYLISQWYGGYTLNLGIYASQYSGNMWTLESVYAFNSNLDVLMGAYGVNVQFDVTDNFSGGALFTNMYSGNDSMTGNKFNDVIKSGAGNDILVGNAGNDKLYGESGNDLLKGGAGNDILYSGTGADKFVFDTTLNATTNLDIIKDFTLKSDKIVLDDDIFKAFTVKGGVSSSQLKVVNSESNLSGNGYLTYVKANDTLYYDSNGSGNGDIAFVKIELAGTAAPSATDFLVIA